MATIKFPTGASPIRPPQTPSKTAPPPSYQERDGEVYIRGEQVTDPVRKRLAQATVQASSWGGAAVGAVGGAAAYLAGGPLAGGALTAAALLISAQDGNKLAAAVTHPFRAKEGEGKIAHALKTAGNGVATFASSAVAFGLGAIGGWVGAAIWGMNAGLCLGEQSGQAMAAHAFPTPDKRPVDLSATVEADGSHRLQGVDRGLPTDLRSFQTPDGTLHVQGYDRGQATDLTFQPHDGGWRSTDDAGKGPAVANPSESSLNLPVQGTAADFLVPRTLHLTND